MKTKRLLLFCVMAVVQVDLFAQATLPSFYPCEGATPQGYTLDLGADSLYAAASACEGSGSLRFGSETENLIIHTASQATSISFKVKGMLGTADFWNGSFHIEESVDGQTWAIIDSIAGQNALPIDACEERTFIPQNPESRYLRLNFFNKFSGNDTVNGGGNVNIDSIYVDGGEVTTIGQTAPSEHAVSVYPNPCKDQIFIQLQEEISQLHVFSIDGKECLFVNTNNSQQIELNTESLVGGIYLLRVIGISGREYNQKIMLNNF
jgi:hypothetical protein